MGTWLGGHQHSGSTFQIVEIEQNRLHPALTCRRGESEGMPEHLPVRTSPGSRPRTVTEGSRRQWEQGCRWPGEGELSVVGRALTVQEPRTIGLPGYRSTQGYCVRLRKKGVRFTFGSQGAGSRAAGDRSAGATPSRTAGTPGTTAPSRTKVTGRPGAPSTTAVPLKGPAGSGVPLKSARTRARLRCDPRACRPGRTLAEAGGQKSQTLSAGSGIQRDWQASEDTSWVSVAVSDLRDEGLDSGRTFVEDSAMPRTSYLSLLSNFLKPVKPAKAAMRLMEKVMEVKKLDKQVKEAQIQQKGVLEETRPLLHEKFQVEADTKFMLDHLTSKTEEYRREMNKLWDKYAQESREIQRKRQELASTYARHTAELQKQLLEKEKKEFDLKRQLRALRDISLVKEKQDREMQTLQEELKKPRAETTAKAYAQFLQEKASLEQELREPDLSLLERRERKELKRKAQALEEAAERLAAECCRDLHTENRRLQEGLVRQVQHCQQVQATHSCLQSRKRQLQQEQWYIDCLLRGRQRLQQGAPKTTRTPPLGTK